MQLKSLKDTMTYNNGLVSPRYVFGTWQTPDDQEGADSVKMALEVGFRHIDTAAAYRNEDSVGRGIKESGIPREEIFITTKLPNWARGYDNVIAAFEDSIKKLGVDQLDLYLMHWPNPPKFRDNYEEMLADSWRAMEDLYKDGRTCAIGISNFFPRHLDQLFKTAKVVPAANQMYLCPGQTQPDTAKYCEEKGIALQAYSPLANGRVFKMPEMQQMAEKYGKSIAQVTLRWALQMGYQTLTKSVTPERIKENADIYGFEIDEADMAYIASAKGAGQSTDPELATF